MKDSGERSQASAKLDTFTLGRDAGVVGRWARLILGSIIPLYSIVRVLLAEQASVEFLFVTTIYFASIFAIYLAAHYYLGERFLARLNPWIGTTILVGPPTIALALSLGPPEFQLALALCIPISLIFNFIMSYGGCRVSHQAFPALASAGDCCSPPSDRRTLRASA